MDILITPDIEGWAIDNIANGIIKHNPHIRFHKVFIHPKEVGCSVMEILNIIKKNRIDLWHAEYWRSAVQMMAIVKQLKHIPSILTHHNHYHLEKEDWNCFKALTSQTKWACNKLKENHPKVVHIPHGIDLDRFSYIPELTEEPNVGYIGRVVSWKNLDKICLAANNLGYKVIGSGYIDKLDYWDKINKNNLEFHGGMGRINMNEALKKDELYKRMKCFVMYSTEEKETGTLPLLEAMARGIPVLATEQGSARDLIQDGENGIIFTPENFEEKLKMVMEDKELRNKLRENAWNTIRGYSEEKMARDHEKLYYQIAWPDKKVISVIIPTFNRAETLGKCMLSVEMNDYEAKEIIIADDGSDDQTKQVVMEARKIFRSPVKYIRTGTKEVYGLAKARNRGAEIASGQILMFLDDRYELEKDVLEKVAKSIVPGNWFFGNKIINGKLANKSNFVENFAWITKKNFFEGGGFWEGFTMYGGLSQETRQRFQNQGYSFNFVNDARAKEIISSKSRRRKKSEIWKAKFLINKMYE